MEAAAGIPGRPGPRRQLSAPPGIAGRREGPIPEGGRPPRFRPTRGETRAVHRRSPSGFRRLHAGTSKGGRHAQRSQESDGSLERLGPRARRALGDGHGLRLSAGAHRRSSRRRPGAGGRLARHGRAGPRRHAVGDHGRDAAPRQGGAARHGARAARRRHALRLVPSRRGAGGRERAALRQGGRRPGGEDRGRPAGDRARAGRGRDPGDGAPRPDAAVDPQAAAASRCRAVARRRGSALLAAGARARAGGRLRAGARVRARRRSPPRSPRRLRIPDHRHRRRRPAATARCWSTTTCSGSRSASRRASCAATPSWAATAREAIAAYAARRARRPLPRQPRRATRIRRRRPRPRRTPASSTAEGDADRLRTAARPAPRERSSARPAARGRASCRRWERCTTATSRWCAPRAASPRASSPRSSSIRPSSAPQEDFGRYPRQPEEDAALLAAAGCDLLFLPEVGDHLPAGNMRPACDPQGAALGLEGERRPGHFDGVATVVDSALQPGRSGLRDLRREGRAAARRGARTGARSTSAGRASCPHPIVREPDGAGDIVAQRLPLARGAARGGASSTARSQAARLADRRRRAPTPRRCAR